MIPDELLQVRDYLRAHPVQLVAGSGDARVDSASSESKIISALQNQQWDFPVIGANVGSQHNRAWYDVKIAGYFCDIKISALKSNDNTNAKMAIFYLLTGKYDDCTDDFKVPVQEDKFFPLMRENENPDEDRDYYYIVVNKNKPGDVFIVNLKGLTPSPAPNNPPFQCKWDEKNLEKRSWQKAKDVLLRAWAKSIQRKIKSLEAGMVANYGEYFK